MSVVEITNLSIYHRGVPQANAVLDTRMGTIDRRIMCGSCGLDVRACPGHCGHIECHVPIFHISFLENTMRCLRSVCYFCSRLLLNSADCLSLARDLSGKVLFNAVYMAARTRKRCMHCEGPQPTYSRAVGQGIRLDWPSDTCWESEEERAEVTGRLWSSVEACSILSHIPDEDVRLMGIDPTRSHPKHTVRATVLVPPPIARPAIMQSTGACPRNRCRPHSLLPPPLAAAAPTRCCRPHPLLPHTHTLAATRFARAGAGRHHPHAPERSQEVAGVAPAHDEHRVDAHRPDGGLGARESAPPPDRGVQPRQQRRAGAAPDGAAERSAHQEHHVPPQGTRASSATHIFAFAFHFIGRP